MAFPHNDGNPKSEQKPVVLAFHSPRRMPQRLCSVMAKEVALINASGLESYPLLFLLDHTSKRSSKKSGKAR